jgi:hypothetical protein
MDIQESKIKKISSNKKQRKQDQKRKRRNKSRRMEREVKQRVNQEHCVQQEIQEAQEAHQKMQQQIQEAHQKMHVQQEQFQHLEEIIKKKNSKITSLLRKNEGMQVNCSTTTELYNKLAFNNALQVQVNTKLAKENNELKIEKDLQHGYIEELECDNQHLSSRTNDLENNTFAMDFQLEEKKKEVNQLTISKIKLSKKYEKNLEEINKLREEGETNQIIFANIQNLLLRIKGTTKRSPTLKILGKNLTPKQMKKYFEIPKSTMSRSRRADLYVLTDKRRTILPLERVPGSHRKQTIKLIIAFWLEYCTVPSGSRRFVNFGRTRVAVHIQRYTTPRLVAMYNSANPQNKVSYNTFLKHKPPYVKMSTLPTKSAMIDICPHCFKLKVFKQRIQNNEELTEEEKKKMKLLETHFHNSKEQMLNYLNQRKAVEEDSTHKKILIVQDFTKFYVDKKRINDLMICVLHWNATKLKYEWLYFDFLEEGKGGLQDYYFVRSIWLFILGVNKFPEGVEVTGTNGTCITEIIKDKTISIFSDGAPQHFKQKKTLSFWVELQFITGITLDINFFVCYHGHNVADAHSSHLKIKIARFIREIAVEQFNDIRKLLGTIKELKNIRIYFIPVNVIDRTASPSEIATFVANKLDGLKSFHRFFLTVESYNLFVLSNSIDCKQILLPTVDLSVPASVLNEQEDVQAVRIVRIVQERVPVVQEEDELSEEVYSCDDSHSDSTVDHEDQDPSDEYFPCRDIQNLVEECPEEAQVTEDNPLNTDCITFENQEQENGGQKCDIVNCPCQSDK